MLNLKRIDDIDEADLQGLITNEVRENQLIEFKAAVNLSVPAARPEFLRDLSSLANASGGDLVIGIEEKDGKAVRIRGSQSPSSDQLQLQIRDLCLPSTCLRRVSDFGGKRAALCGNPLPNTFASRNDDADMPRWRS